MRRAFSGTLRGETRPLKCICPPPTCSPHSDLSYPPLRVRCAERVHQHHSSSVWQLGDASGLPPLPSIHFPPADRVIGDTLSYLLQRTGPASATFQSSGSLSIIPNKDAEGFSSGWRTSPRPDLLDTPCQVLYVFLSTTLCFLYRIYFTNGSIYQGYFFGISTQFGPATHFSLGEIPPLRRGSADSSKQLEGFCATAGTLRPPTKWRNRGSTSVGHQARLFQLLLPHTKKRRWPKTHSGPALPEPLPLQREVQDVDVEDYHVPDSGRGLVRHYRPEGCLFSHPGRQAAQDVASVCLWRKGLPIQSPSLWPGLGAEDIHEVHACCTGPFEAPGHSHAQLRGRLAHSGPLQGVSESSQGYRPPSHSFSWPQNERQEECSLPLSANCVLGGSLAFRCRPI